MHLEAAPLGEMAQIFLLKALPLILNPKFIDFLGDTAAEAFGETMNFDDAIVRAAESNSVQNLQAKPGAGTLEKTMFEQLGRQPLIFVF